MTDKPVNHEMLELATVGLDAFERRLRQVLEDLPFVPANGSYRAKLAALVSDFVDLRADIALRATGRPAHQPGAFREMNLPPSEEANNLDQDVFDPKAPN